MQTLSSNLHFINIIYMKIWSKCHFMTYVWSRVARGGVTDQPRNDNHLFE